MSLEGEACSRDVSLGSNLCVRVKVLSLDKITQGMNRKNCMRLSLAVVREMEKSAEEPREEQLGSWEETQTIWHPENQEKKMP